jgi:hypothetical protein
VGDSRHFSRRPPRRRRAGPRGRQGGGACCPRLHGAASRRVAAPADRVGGGATKLAQNAGEVPRPALLPSRTKRESPRRFHVAPPEVTPAAWPESQNLRQYLPKSELYDDNACSQRGSMRHRFRFHRSASSFRLSQNSPASAKPATHPWVASDRFKLALPPRAYHAIALRCGITS